MFNITNFAQFENIEFTGEDNLVNFVRLTDDFAIEKQMDIINSAPFSLCSY